VGTDGNFFSASLQIDLERFIEGNTKPDERQISYTSVLSVHRGETDPFHFSYSIDVLFNSMGRVEEVRESNLRVEWTQNGSIYISSNFSSPSFSKEQVEIFTDWLRSTTQVATLFGADCIANYEYIPADQDYVEPPRNFSNLGLS
ncbi:MAG: hypothetical protein AAF988_02260, partial [Pseudomonadota bacterium]